MITAGSRRYNVVNDQCLNTQVQRRQSRHRSLSVRESTLSSMVTACSCRVHCRQWSLPSHEGTMVSVVIPIHADGTVSMVTVGSSRSEVSSPEICNHTTLPDARVHVIVPVFQHWQRCTRTAAQLELDVNCCKNDVSCNVAKLRCWCFNSRERRRE